MARQQVYTLLIVLSSALILARILTVDQVDVQRLQATRLAQIENRLDEKEKRLRQTISDEEAIAAEIEKTRIALETDAKLESPMFSANDRSRWCTIRVLVEPEMRVTRVNPKTESLEYVWYAIDHVQTLKGWGTIDMVKHDLPDQPGIGYLYSSKPPLLPTLLAIPYAVTYNVTDGHCNLQDHPYFIVRLTLIITHLIPLILTWILLARLIEKFGTTDWGRIFTMAFICFGTFLSTFAITINNHIPAAFCMTVALYCGVRIFFDGDQRWRYFIGAGFFGMFGATCELPALSFVALLGLFLLIFSRHRTLLGFLPAVLVILVAFFGTNYIAHKTFKPAYSNPSWYIFDYEREGKMRESHWKNPVGLDIGEPSRLTYLFHTTFGHHGYFSLTPVWLLGLFGLLLMTANNRRQTADEKWLWYSASVLLISTVVLIFYVVVQSQGNRNYGGMTCGLRWLFWFVPLWTIPVVVAADRFASSTFGKMVCFGLLVVSIFSATYPIWNPWTHPWLYNVLMR